jgi:hypothetical protein
VVLDGLCAAAAAADDDRAPTTVVTDPVEAHCSLRDYQLGGAATVCSCAPPKNIGAKPIWRGHGGGRYEA